MIPSLENVPTPFHKGETIVQSKLGLKEFVEPFAKQFIRPFMLEEHQEFYESQPFLVGAARDDRGKMWSTLLFGTINTNTNDIEEEEEEDKVSDQDAKFVISPSPTELAISGGVVPGDALEYSMVEGMDLGILGIEFATRRRNRVNGRIVKINNKNNRSGPPVLHFQVDQSFGNCPQYIKPRKWWSEATNHNSSHCAIPQPNISPRAKELNPLQIKTIQKAETIFVATGYNGSNSSNSSSRSGERDPRHGNDASHRGGPAGWIKVINKRILHLPDYSGNNMFNTLGNLQLDNRMGITIPRYEKGGMIQLTGTATVDWDEFKARLEHGPDAHRTIVFEIDEIVDVPDGSLPLRWSDHFGQAMEPRKLVVTQRRRVDVVSFLLQAPIKDVQRRGELWNFKPGQHLPISLNLGNSDDELKTIERTYSLSGGPDWGEYRISVKRERHGVASQFRFTLEIQS